YLDRIRSGLAEQGIPFYVLVAPAKWDVYPEKLPDWAQSIRGSGPLDQLLARYPDLPIIDVREPLREAKKDHDVYAAVNPHWTNYGGFVAWDAVATCLRSASPELGDLGSPAITGVTTEADRNEFSDFGIADPAPDWTVPTYATDLRPVRITDAKGTRTVPGTREIDMLDLPLRTDAQGAATASTALIARDSFGNAFNIPADQEFTTTWQVRHNLDGAADTQPDLVKLAAQDHPDVLILELTQRYLAIVPAPTD
ncbi:MAG TPA: hypothetical protein VFQ54_03450, partial [Thermomicrobiales bacterium]|nr:hypothetical protein [Thermomicrobiales bacterium]